jgi:peptidoglycan/xylan/chitin deacetylase (PgdA/CDA1 family)
MEDFQAKSSKLPMNLPDSAIWFYRQMTHRHRSQVREELRRQSRLPVAILFYHRVAKVNWDNPWSISFDNFRRHLDWLEDNYPLVSLGEAQKRIRQVENDELVVSITFDDGYAENADYAIPELIERKIPVTYFVATDFVQNGSGFPHDLQFGFNPQPNSLPQLREFVAKGVELGSHSKTHANIGSIVDSKHLVEEIAGSIQVLRQWIAPFPCRYFAFPYGLPENMSQEAVDLLRELGIEGFCSAYGALNWPGNEGTHLRRIHADPGMERLKNWLTLDTRKLKDTVNLPFEEPPQRLPESLISLAR